MNEVYENPKYYEIAFSYRHIPEEVDVLTQVIQRYSLIPVSTILELGCGHTPHLAELVRRQYNYIGLDLSPEMLDYAQKKADEINASASGVEPRIMEYSTFGSAGLTALPERSMDWISLIVAIH
jgi:cyclopropane fatty-acyl-phospholipid synthase-like methyltransferase